MLQTMINYNAIIIYSIIATNPSYKSHFYAVILSSTVFLSSDIIRTKYN